MAHRGWVLGMTMSIGCGVLPPVDIADASASVSATGGADELTHGSIRLELRRGESQAANPYVGTARVVATMTYRECLLDFYENNPGLRQTGPDGEAVFGSADLGGEGWMDRLCTGDDAAQASCTVESIDQRLDAEPGLTVVYVITGELENRSLRFGPIPTTETADCLDAIVHISNVDAVNGRDAEDNQIWVTEAFAPTEAITDQGGPIVIRAARVED